ncbi:Nnf1-domain-containing protein [Kalaharituber pfeilii]|nr:Nnf1-domain-containing protein [Kalaharituber pfeilii]
MSAEPPSSGPPTGAPPALSAAAAPPPGPEPAPATPGLRATAFREVLSRALHHTLKGLTDPHFLSCFPTPAAHPAHRATLLDVHRQLITQYDALATASFENVLERFETVTKLNELDRLIEEAKARKAKAEAEAEKEKKGGPSNEKEVIPSTLPPLSILSLHLAPHLLKAQTALLEKLDVVQKENEVLVKKLEEQREEVLMLEGKLRKVVEEVEGTVKVVRESVVEGEKEEIAEGTEDREEKEQQEEDVEMVQA